MQVHRSTLGDATVLSCAGRLTMVGAPTLRSAIDEAVTDGRVRLVVDLAGTSFVDSSGLGALVAGLKRTRQAGGDLRIASAQEQVRMVLELTNLDRILQPFDTVGDAVHDW
jgi:anti-sigma B factor antagonist